MGSGVEERDITVASIEERCPTAAACVLAAGESAVVCGRIILVSVLVGDGCSTVVE